MIATAGRRRLGWAPSLGPPDRVLTLLALALSATGLLLVWSATRLGGGHALLVRQAVAVGAGLVLMWLVSRVDLRVLRAYVPLAYVLALVSLAGVLSPLGVRVNGAHSWIVLAPGVQFQPSEFAKVALALAFAVPLGELRDGQGRPGFDGVVLALVLAAVPIGLIALQPDVGTMLVFAAMVAGALLVSGAPKRWLLVLVAGAAGAGAAAWQLGLVRPYQLERLLVLVRPGADPGGIGYNAAQARIAIGSGGLSGKGLFNGEQTAGHFVPEQHTDFIFTVAGEELGFAGAALIVLAVFALLWRALSIARHAASRYGAVLAGGLVSWIGFQTFMNVGMTVGLMPIVGVPLPFVSYGGSATVAGLVAIGLLQAVHRSKPMQA
ncbi:rod shape-determining protein RodA [Nonomuraea gerenzanensis]|uniref:peptidoglycan glycosyltransferase n=1 Tax=Nonomuraea gerenzanensis TaxID=93944 RepID=A0A1M4EHM3_9ACTN|nr:rod shape-determining protein RodA [Nonomuraea gerenzanensis]UBU10090.1 rod shape-determining protein RodA [Nonomuraea gerenzanensis]SBO98461.1 Cell division protein FtsW [Nonomuraea gerenzanensis]